MVKLTENRGYGDAVKCSEACYSDELKSAPEINPPADLTVFFAPTCSPRAQPLIDKLWIKVMQ